MAGVPWADPPGLMLNESLASEVAITDIAEQLNVEVGFHRAAKASMVKLLIDDRKKKTIAQLDSELNQLISKEISSNEVIDNLVK